ncbi:MAG: (Fe-S)-binding protein [Chloroflexota bacterium]
MALEDYRDNMEICSRCSACKFIPLEMVEGMQHVDICPSISRYNFHAYSGGGRLGTAIAMLDKRFDYSGKLVEIMYNCQTCGGCDVSCKYGMDMDVLEPIYELRIKAVEDGHTIPALDKVINSLRKQGTMVPGAKARRGAWAAGLDVKDATRQKVKVLYHVGCLTSYDRDMWQAAQATVKLLKKADVDFGIAYENESCCGGRAYQMGYQDAFLAQARRNTEMVKKAGAETLVTTCAEGYHAFKVLYDKFDLKGDLEVLHITEYLARLVREGKLKPAKKLNIDVTYHDPCYLGRLGEPYIHWQGKRVPGHMYRFEPQKVYRRGTYGVYEPPRDVLRSIPGIRLVEMDRTREYAWCCGAGGGVVESNPEFSTWTALERIREAEATGAEALVTACPWCVKNFNEAIKENGSSLKVYDVVELLAKAI